MRLAIRRPWCTRLALGLLAAASLETLLALVHPFPLLSDGRGGYSDAPNFWIVLAAFATSMLAGLFSLIADQWRGRLFCFSLALSLLSYLAMFTNGH